MGFSWRRSRSIGPFRLSASKRGLGISAGGPSGRVSRSATGRRSFSIRLPFGFRYRGKL
jgi:hypothetical protein